MDNHNLKIKGTIMSEYKVYNYGSIATIIVAKSYRYAIAKAFRYFGKKEALNLEIVKVS